MLIIYFSSLIHYSQLVFNVLKKMTKLSTNAIWFALKERDQKFHWLSVSQEYLQPKENYRI